MGTSINKTAGIAALALTLIPTGTLAQDAGDGGVVLTFGFDSSLTIDDNLTLAEGGSPGTSTVWDSRLSFRVQNTTQTQSLDFQASSVLRWADLPGGATFNGVEEPTMRLSYRREGAASLLTVEAFARSVDLEFLGPLSDPGLPGNNIGTLRQTTARVTLETGIGRTIGTRLTAGYDDQNFVGTVDPDLFDTTTRDVGARVNFRVTPVATAFVDLGRTWYEDDDVGNKQETTDTLSVGVDYEIDRRTLVSASVGYSQVDTTEFGGSSTNDGIVYSLGATRELRNGNASARLTSELDGTSSITTLTFGRSMELPRGTFSGELGFTRLANGSQGVIGSLAYRQDLNDDRIELRLDRTFFTDDGDDKFDTRLGVTYSHEIDAISTLGVEFAYGRVEDGGVGAAPTEEEASLTASYSREIARDWNLEGGVVFRYSDDGAVPGSAQSNAVFLTLGRDFSFRP
ncbi:MAG: hypothetical protein N2422_02295 [Rhodobacteraceae bacterium]|nr:hypothetical protein [Paracoccaceae bacterium]